MQQRVAAHTRRGPSRFLEGSCGVLARFLKDERGATAIEYGLIATLVGLVALLALGVVFQHLGAKINTVSNAVQ